MLTRNRVILVMNYLAHAFLSFNKEDILAGNMISDFVKGKAKYNYPAGIQNGIQLHRLIDEFTDTHPVTAEAKNYFRPQYRLYSGAFIDVVYDHFLALDEKQFATSSDLEIFSENVYLLLGHNAAFFPMRFQKMFPYMQSQNWLYNYRLKEGIQKSFNGLVYRAAYLHESDIAFEIFNEHYTELQSCYLQFFPELLQFALEKASHFTAV
ncbi:MAG TPA: ACP phosphodiesterase [Ginsengibacter sp.]